MRFCGLIYYFTHYSDESNTCHDSELQTQDMDKMSESQKEHREKEI